MGLPSGWRMASIRERMSDFLGSMAHASRARANDVKARAGVTGLQDRVSSARPPHPLVLPDHGFDLIAEAKLASPKDGVLIDAVDPRAVSGLAGELAGTGAAALSILTEPEVFRGSIEHVEHVASSVEIPVMRKDFLVDPIQILESRAAGASGVLLIARMLAPALLAEMTDLTLDLGMFALVELFEPADVESAVPVFDREVLVGVNARDLATLNVEPARHAGMRPMLPDHLPAVAESGITTEGAAVAVAELGYRLALVGRALLTSGNPAETARGMIAAGRSAAGVRSSV